MLNIIQGNKMSGKQEYTENNDPIIILEDLPILSDEIFMNCYLKSSKANNTLRHKNFFIHYVYSVSTNYGIYFECSKKLN